LPAATFAESEGTIINNEGRAQRFYKAVENKNQVKESWKWLVDFIQIRESDHSYSWNRLDDIVESLANELPVFSKLTKYMPDADFRMLNTKIPRQTMRYSGRASGGSRFTSEVQYGRTTGKSSVIACPVLLDTRMEFCAGNV
jgi:NADH-quinone oxidoreductase subunit G